MKITEQNLIKQLKKKNPQAIDYIIDQYGGLIKTVLLKNLYDQKDHWEECFNDCQKGRVPGEVRGQASHHRWRLFQGLSAKDRNCRVHIDLQFIWTCAGGA